MNKLAHYALAIAAAIAIFAVAFGSSTAHAESSAEKIKERALAIAAEFYGGKNIKEVSCSASRLEGSEDKTTCKVTMNDGDKAFITCEFVVGRPVCYPI
ncbi:MAG: hypothetical protein PHE17_19555 [Thiothrix sp.]|uniref:hypothetical protein n=1 Tax=Thiothrix sp. TaxID=1032 RepID=UPI00263120FF|nr:hypothetical protein [Thiothrix sp.]MDD5395225.1 hypothetical protein [Thiothrix sp.]